MSPLRKWRRGDVGGRWFFHAKAMVHRMVSTEGRERGRGEVSPPNALSLTSVVRDKRRGADVRSRSSKGKFQFRVSPPTHTDERATRGHFEGSL